MSNERENFNKVIKQKRQEAEERERKRAPIKEKGKEMGLKSYPSIYSSVWVDEDYQPGVIPSHFYVESITEDGRLELKERRISFPVKDFGELLETIDSLDEFYRASTESLVLYMRHGLEGFTDFLKELERNTVKENRLRGN